MVYNMKLFRTTFSSFFSTKGAGVDDQQLVELYFYILYHESKHKYYEKYEKKSNLLPPSMGSVIPGVSSVCCCCF